MKSRTRIVFFLAGTTMSFAAVAASPDSKSRTQTQEPIRRSVVQRSHSPRDAQADAQRLDNLETPRGGAAIYPNEFRTIDGLNNNFANPLWGAASINMMRMMSADYPLSSGEIPARMDGPSPRAVSNAVCDSPGDIPNAINASDFLWQWGQFVDHDIDETPVSNVALDIPVPMGDPWFDPMNTGTQVIGMNRSAFAMDGSGERQQLNEITSFIDGSNVYGADAPRAAALRTNDGTGRLVTSPGNFLPFNTAGFDNAPTGADPTLFLAGDVRANEQVALTAMHTLFMREHNYWAGVFAEQFPLADGDELYGRARAIVGAEIQAITFNEFLPVFLGENAFGPYAGYNPTMRPDISNEFASAAYRVGHTMLSSTLKRLDATDQEAAEGHLPLQQGFFVPAQILDNDIDSVLRGLASNPSQKIDTYVVDDVRNFLFGAPGSGGFDLASLNIQRGRDHGLPDYNATRQAFGLPAMTSLDQISDDPAIDAGLASVYSTIDEVDPWVGLLAEPAVDGSMVGETLQVILVDQFTRLRSGDRFWYEAYLPADLVNMVNQQTLSTIIKRNTGVGDELSDDVFHATAPCPGDVNNDGHLNFFDISAFMGLFASNDPRADFDGDESFNFFDISEFLNLFEAGCP